MVDSVHIVGVGFAAANLIHCGLHLGHIEVRRRQFRLQAAHLIGKRLYVCVLRRHSRRHCAHFGGWRAVVIAAARANRKHQRNNRNHYAAAAKQPPDYRVSFHRVISLHTLRALHTRIRLHFSIISAAAAKALIVKSSKRSAYSQPN